MKTRITEDLNFDRFDLFLNEKYEGFCPTVCIDVDYTLINPDGSVNQTMRKAIIGLKEKYGDRVDIVVWSTGGKKYAREAVDKAGISEYVDIVMSKPIYIVDDCGEDWHFNSLTIIEFNCTRMR